MADENNNESAEELRLKAEVIKEMASDARSLAEELTKWNQALGDTGKTVEENSESIKKSLEEIIEKIILKEEMDKKDLDILKNIADLQRQGIKLGDEEVKLSQAHSDILKQIVKSQQQSYNYELQSLISSGKSLDLRQRMRKQQEEIAKLTDQERKLALQGWMFQALQLDRLARHFKEAINTISEMRAEMNKLTLDSRQYAAEALSVARNTAGLAPKEALAVQKELALNFSEFTKMSKTQREDFIQTTAIFERLGVSLSTQTKTAQMFTKSMGLGANASTAFFSKLVSFSQKSGISMGELNKNLEATGGQLRNFATNEAQLTKVFTGLSKATKELGIEMSTLLSITEQFTTFEGASRAAGQLNAALGGNFISGMKLMKASIENPVDALKQLRDGLEKSGKSFNQLGLADQRFFASILGKSVQETASLFKKTTGEFNAELDLQAKKQKELEEISAKSTAVMQRFSLIFQKLMASKVVEKLGDALEWIASGLEGLTKEGNLVGAFLSNIVIPIGGVLVAVNLMRKAFFALRVPFLLMKNGFKDLGDSSKKSSDEVKNSSDKIDKSSNTMSQGMDRTGNSATKFGSKMKKLLIVLGAVAAAGAGIGAIFYGWAKISESSAKKTEANTRQAEVLSSIGSMISSMNAALIKRNLDTVAAGIQQIGVALGAITNTEALDKIAQLTGAGSLKLEATSAASGVNTNVMPVEIVKINLEQERQQQVQLAQQTQPAGTDKPIKLEINSPIKLDGADFGRMLYNGYMIIRDAENKKLSPNPSLLTPAYLLNYTA